MRKKIWIFVLALFILCIPAQLFAADESTNVKNIVSPMWTYIVDYQNTFSISSSGLATVYTTLNASSGNKVVITSSIQKYANGSWSSINSWTTTSYSGSGALYQTWNLASGYNYRMVSNGAVYQNSVLLEQTSYTSPIRWY